MALTPADFREIKAPVALLWGSYDPCDSIEPSRAGARHFATAEFHAVGIGHLPWRNEPAACGELLRAFPADHE